MQNQQLEENGTPWTIVDMDGVSEERDKAEVLIRPKTIREYVQQVTDAVSDGWLSPLEAMIGLKRMAEVSSQAISKVNEKAMNEARSFEKGQEINGAKVDVRNTAGKWDYSHIPEIEAKKNELKDLQEKAKSLYHATKGGDIEAYSTADGSQIKPAKYLEGKEQVFIKLLDK